MNDARPVGDSDLLDVRVVRKAFRSASGERADVLRDVPALAEAVPGYAAYIWDALAGPTGMPAETVALLNREINAVLTDPAIKARMLALGAEPMVMSVAQAAAFVADETVKWGKVIRDAGIKAE